MLQISYSQFKNCCACKKSLRYYKNISRVGESTLNRTRVFFNNNHIQLNDLICGNCRSKSYQNKKSSHAKKSLIPFNDSHSTSNDVEYINIREKKNMEDSQLLNGPKRTNDILDTSKNNEEKNESTTVENDKIKLYRASSTHKHCLMCKKKRGLHIMKIESILFAYKYYGTFIDTDSRCCTRHLESNGDIKENDFKKIKKTIHDFDQNSIKILDLWVINTDKVKQNFTESSGIFDKFKDMALLEDDLCKKITGWCKIDFIRFSEYIKNIRDTAGRTKEQLIAIYRFWLLKGLDQSTLAMLKFDTSQQQISHYLCQIRNAINNEFVPQFLGAHKGKDFFLKHNTQSVKILHDFEDDCLAIIADGTYTRLEKSTNNEFQYLSYSSQKLDNLIKPFILCCADGYFIDCYGPFQASFNDASILKYILETDEHLQKISNPSDKIMFFLDRGKCLKFMLLIIMNKIKKYKIKGFRNLYWDLVKNGFKVRIPTCLQLSQLKDDIPELPKELTIDDLNEQTILSTSQASDTRLVTKVLF
jgi:hypothetical protein